MAFAKRVALPGTAALYSKVGRARDSLLALRSRSSAPSEQELKSQWGRFRTAVDNHRELYNAEDLKRVAAGLKPVDRAFNSAAAQLDRPGTFSTRGAELRPTLAQLESGAFEPYFSALDVLREVTPGESRELVIDPAKLIRDSAIMTAASWPERTRDWVYVDLETSSIGVEFGEIIEFGAVRVSPEGEIVAEMNERFDMGSPEVREKLGTGAVAIHGISPDDIAGKRKFTDPAVQSEIRSILDGAVLVAHNAAFEWSWLALFLDGFIDSYMDEYGRQKDVVDSALFLKLLMRDKPNCKLESLVVGVDLDYENAHQAYDDALMTHRALTRLLDKVTEKKAPADYVIDWF